MENGAPANEGKDPSGFLSQIIGNAVTVKLNSGVVYRGGLGCYLLILTHRRRLATPNPCLAPICEHILTFQSIKHRRAAVCRWLHEHRAREDGGVCQRPEEAVLRGRLRERQQR